MDEIKNWISDISMKICLNSFLKRIFDKSNNLGTYYGKELTFDVCIVTFTIMACLPNKLTYIVTQQAHLLHGSFAKIIYNSLSELGGRGKSTKVTRANFLIL